jgi:hypothetical protein
MSACVGTYSRRCSPAGPMPLKCSEPKLIEDADRVRLGLPDLSRRDLGDPADPGSEPRLLV